jgi:hypothetical protein
VTSAGGSIEVVRGRLAEDRAEQILAFWSAHGALEGEAARQRLPEVVCLAVGDAGQIIGVNSAHAEDTPLVRRRFWRYRSFAPGGDDELAAAMFNAAFEALGDGFDPDEPGPIGLSVQVSDPAEAERRPEAIWPGEELFFAGYLDEATHLRLRYFWNAKIGPGPPDSPPLEDTMNEEYPVDESFLVSPLDESGLTPEDVLALWGRETGIPQEDARRRVHEVQLVAVKDGALAGVSTAYIQRNAQLRMDLWHYRTYIAEAHRHSHLAGRLALAVRDHLERQFVEGADTRASGMAMEIENEGLKTYFNRALWLPLNFKFIGENAHRQHVRVHYFPGVRIPPRSS